MAELTKYLFVMSQSSKTEFFCKLGIVSPSARVDFNQIDILLSHVDISHVRRR